MADAEIAFNDPDNRIDHDDVAQQEIERTLSTGDTGHPNSIAKGLAAAMQAFVAIHGVVLFHNGDQRCVAKPNGVTCGRTVERRVITAVDARHVTPL
jgi:S-adenosylmethionine synthetase